MDLFDFTGKDEIEPVPQDTKGPAWAAAPVIREKRDRPFTDIDGGLVIPFGSDRRYHWWAGGQSVEETMKEI